MVDKVAEAMESNIKHALCLPICNHPNWKKKSSLFLIKFPVNLLKHFIKICSFAEKLLQQTNLFRISLIGTLVIDWGMIPTFVLPFHPLLYHEERMRTHRTTTRPNPPAANWCRHSSVSRNVSGISGIYVWDQVINNVFQNKYHVLIIYSVWMLYSLLCTRSTCPPVFPHCLSDTHIGSNEVATAAAPPSSSPTLPPPATAAAADRRTHIPS